MGIRVIERGRRRDTQVSRRGNDQGGAIAAMKEFPAAREISILDAPTFTEKTFSSERDVLLDLWPELEVFMESRGDPFNPSAFSIEDLWFATI